MNTTRARCAQLLIAVIALIAFHVTNLLSAEDDRWGKFDFEGNRSFHRQQLIDAFIGNERFLLATHPSADPLQLPSIMQELLVVGYRRAGFIDPQVKVTTDTTSSRTKVQITEGFRLRCGDVIIQGSSVLDRQRLIDRITKPFADAKTFPTYQFVDGQQRRLWVNENGEDAKLQEPIWERDAWCQFDSQRRLENKLKAAFSDLGHSQAEFRFSLKPNVNEQFVALHIDLLDEGQADTIDDIVVTGVKLHSQRDIIEFLQLEIGSSIDRATIDALNERLWDSGRFDKQRVAIVRNQDPRRLELQIDLQEVDSVPPVSASISDEAKAFMQARKWISQFSSRDQDLVIERESVGHHFLLTQSADALLLKYKSLTPDPTTGEALCFAVLIDRDQILVFFSPLNRKYHGRFTTGDRQIRLGAGMKAVTKDDNFINHTIGFKIKSERESHQRPVELALDLQPSGFLPFAYNAGIEHHWLADTLTSTYRDNTVRINRHTGEVSMQLPLGELKFENDRLKAERGLLLQQTKSIPQAYEKSKPLGSLAAYLCDPKVLATWSAANRSVGKPIPEIDPNLVSAMQKFLTAGFLQPLDTMIIDASSSESKIDEFKIVEEQPPFAGRQTGLWQIGAKFCLQYVSKVFPEHSWPLLVIRESCLVMLGHQQFAGSTLQRIHGSKVYGPICHASVAWLIGFVKPEFRSRFAVRGLQEFNETNFDRDYRDLFNGSTGEWMQRMLDAFQSLEPEEVDAILAKVSSERVRQALYKVYLTKESDPGVSAGQMWFRALRSDLETWLRAMAKS